MKAMLALPLTHVGKSLHLPAGLALWTERDKLMIGPRELLNKEISTPDFEYPLKIPGTTDIPGWRITAEFAPANLDPKTLNPTAALFDAGKLGLNPVVRNRRPGDYMQPLGMAGRKKLKDLFIDLKIPRNLRPSTPLLVSDSGVLWVFPHRVSELAKVDETTRRRLLVRWEPSP